MKVTGSNVPTNEIGNVVVEVGCPEGDLLMQQGLLEADIETSTRLRSKIGIGDRVERWEVHIQFGQGRFPAQEVCGASDHVVTVTANAQLHVWDNDWILVQQEGSWKSGLCMRAAPSPCSTISSTRYGAANASRPTI